MFAHEREGKQVALKVLPRKLADDPELLLAFDLCHHVRGHPREEAQASLERGLAVPALALAA